MEADPRDLYAVPVEHLRGSQVQQAAARHAKIGGHRRGDERMDEAGGICREQYLRSGQTVQHDGGSVDGQTGQLGRMVQRHRITEDGDGAGQGDRLGTQALQPLRDTSDHSLRGSGADARGVQSLPPFGPARELAEELVQIERVAARGT